MTPPPPAPDLLGRYAKQEDGEAAPGAGMQLLSRFESGSRSPGSQPRGRPSAL